MGAECQAVFALSMEPISGPRLGGRAEILCQAQQGHPLAVDFGGGSDPQPADERQRRAPALKGVEEEKGGDDGGKPVPGRVDEVTEGEAQQREAGGACFQGSFGVPFRVQFPEPAVYRAGVLPEAADALVSFAGDFVIDGRGRVLFHSGGVVRKQSHAKHPPSFRY